jgi:hypothetical protein
MMGSGVVYSHVLAEELIPEHGKYPNNVFIEKVCMLEVTILQVSQKHGTLRCSMDLPFLPLECNTIDHAPVRVW